MVALHGELDPNGATALREALIEAIDENPSRHVFVDLEGVDFVDSRASGCSSAVASGDGELVLVATGRSAVKVIHPSCAAAVSGAPSMTG